MRHPICRRIKEALECGEALLRVWRRLQIDAAGVLVGWPANPVAEWPLPRRYVVQPQHAHTTCIVPVMLLVPAFLLRRVGSCSGAEDSMMVMEHATHVHAQRRHFGHEECVVHGILKAVLRWVATSVK
jgi:hypothetical protein